MDPSIPYWSEEFREFREHVAMVLGNNSQQRGVSDFSISRTTRVMTEMKINPTRASMLFVEAKLEALKGGGRMGHLLPILVHPLYAQHYPAGWLRP